jgi:hypothetical protein
LIPRTFDLEEREKTVMMTTTRRACGTVLFLPVTLAMCGSNTYAQSHANDGRPSDSRSIVDSPLDNDSVMTARSPISLQPAMLVTPAAPTWKHLFTDTVHEFRQLPSRENLEWLVAGLAVTAAAHVADDDVLHKLSDASELRPAARPGAVLGSTPFELAGATALYVFGRAGNHPRLAHVGGDLVRAQLMAEALALGIKHAVRRDRPEGSGFSFPSGHATVSFASATVLQRHFGWKVGAPAYGVAGYIALSRVQMRRHYLSDVAIGATLGIIAGRTITLGHERAVRVEPLASPDGAGLQFRWIGKKP